MKKSSKLKTGGVITLIIGVTLLTMGLMDKKEEGSKEKLYEGEQINLSVSSSPKIEIKKLSQSTNEEGHEEISFGYEIIPLEATNKSVTISLAWTNENIEANISEYLTYKEAEDRIITLTCLKRANMQAQMTITSNSNTEVKASIKIDFNKQFLGFKATECYIVKEITSFDDLTISKEDIIAEINRKSNGFGEGTRFSASNKITNLVIKESTEQYTFSNNNKNVNNSFTLVNLKNYVIADQFIETLSMGYGKPFKEMFTNSDAESNLLVASDGVRASIAVYNYFSFYSKTKVDFTLYGESYSFTLKFYHMVKTEILTDYLVVPVSSIGIEVPNIVF